MNYSADEVFIEKSMLDVLDKYSQNFSHHPDLNEHFLKMLRILCDILVKKFGHFTIIDCPNENEFTIEYKENDKLRKYVVLTDKFLYYADLPLCEGRSWFRSRLKSLTEFLNHTIKEYSEAQK